MCESVSMSFERLDLGIGSPSMFILMFWVLFIAVLYVWLYVWALSMRFGGFDILILCGFLYFSWTKLQSRSGIMYDCIFQYLDI
jgi:hypothetical protein